MKKVLVLLVLLLGLTGCGNKATNDDSKKESKDTSKYIEPAVLVNYVDYLNDETKSLVMGSNTAEDIPTNNDMERLGKPLCDIKVEDINGKELNFADLKNKKVILEVVAEWCGNCQSQAKELTPALVEALPSDVVFIQYFNVGTVDQIKEFYKKLDMPVPSNIIIIPENNDLKTYLTNDLKLEYYPTFLFFNNGVLTWSSWGSFSTDSYKKCEDVSFKNPIDLKKLVDNNGKSIFENGKTAAEVEKELSVENIEKLKAINSDGKNASYKTTLNVVGNKIDFSKITEKDLKDVPLIEDFTKYQDENVIVFYTVLDEETATDYEIINKVIAENPDYKYIVLLKQGSDTNIKYNGEIKGAEVSMAKANVPDDLLNLKIDRIPVAVCIEKGVVTGAIAAIQDPEMVKNNLLLFFGDGAIALKKNNQ